LTPLHRPLSTQSSPQSRVQVRTASNCFSLLLVLQHHADVGESGIDRCDGHESVALFPHFGEPVVSCPITCTLTQLCRASSPYSFDKPQHQLAMSILHESSPAPSNSTLLGPCWLTSYWTPLWLDTRFVPSSPKLYVIEYGPRSRGTKSNFPYSVAQIRTRSTAPTTGASSTPGESPPHHRGLVSRATS